MQHMHNACMVSITIRNVPEETRDELAARAARSGRSLQEFLRGELITMVSKPDMETVLERARVRAKAAGTKLSVEEILEYRDSGRR
jgi:plasmid stability protein